MKNKQLPIPGLDAPKLRAKIGDVKKGLSIGQSMQRAYFTWLPCPDCGKERWVRLIKNEPRYQLCRACALKEVGKRMSMENSSQWRGGRRITPAGYILIKLAPDDFFYSMCKTTGIVFEHRLVMAKHLGRCLHNWELVHHKGIRYPRGSAENRQDNEIDNLQLITDDRHKQISLLENKIDKLLEGQRELKQEIRLLRLQNKLLKAQREEEG